MILPWIQSVEKYVHDNNLDCHINLLCSEICYDLAINDSKIKSKISYIKNTALCDIFSNYQEYIDLKKNNPNSDKLKKLSKIIIEKIDGKEPDILIGCSNNMGFIENFFEKTIILYNESGLFGYIKDFNHTLHFDVIQNNQSYLSRIKIDDIQIDLEDSEISSYNLLLKNIRDFFFDQSNKVDITKIVDTNRYKKLGLFALQRWDSELMQMNTDFKSELDYIEYILRNVSYEYGLLITIHKSSSIIADTNIQKLLYKKYPNIKIIDDKIETPSISLLNYCDFVITNSSTTGFYATLLDKMLLVTSESSWLRNLAECFKVEEFNKAIGLYISKENLSLTKYKHLLIFYFFTSSHLFFSGEFFYNYIKNIFVTNSSKDIKIPYSKNVIKNFINCKKTDEAKKRISLKNKKWFYNFLNLKS